MGQSATVCLPSSCQALQESCQTVDEQVFEATAEAWTVVALSQEEQAAVVTGIGPRAAALNQTQTLRRPDGAGTLLGARSRLLEPGCQKSAPRSAFKTAVQAASRRDTPRLESAGQQNIRLGAGFGGSRLGPAAAAKQQPRRLMAERAMPSLIEVAADSDSEGSDTEKAQPRGRPRLDGEVCVGGIASALRPVRQNTWRQVEGFGTWQPGAEENPKPEKELPDEVKAFMAEHKFNGINEMHFGGSDPFQYTFPLHRAVELNDVEMVKTLLEAGADARVTDSEGLTPVQTAVRRNGGTSHQAVLDAFADFSLRRFW